MFAILKRFTSLDDPAIRNANRGDFAQIDSPESSRSKINPNSHRIRAICTNRLKPKPDSQKRVQFRNPQAIRANRPIRANLRIDSREWGHLRDLALSKSLGKILRRLFQGIARGICDFRKYLFQNGFFRKYLFQNGFVLVIILC